MSYVGREPNFGQFRKVDVSSWTFNASNVSFPLGDQVGNVNQLIVSLNGVIQEPTSDYLLQAGGNNLVFTTAPDSGDSCFAMVFGDVGGPPIVTGGVTSDMLAANLKTFSEFTRTFQGESDSCGLNFTPSAKGALLVSIDGVVQAQDNFTLSGSTISFDSALDSNSVLRVVDLGIKSAVFVPVDGSVTSGKLADFAVKSSNLDSSIAINSMPMRINTQNVTSSITIDSNKNASLIGPITIDSGVSITVNGNFTVI
tara:strand:- start:660 stop:1424 length:765 start_codon:yes stop_codon:yes gene_type:complete